MGCVRQDWGYVRASPAPEATPTREREEAQYQTGDGHPSKLPQWESGRAARAPHAEQKVFCIRSTCVLSQARDLRPCGFAGSPHPDPVHDGSREPHGTCWVSPSIMDVSTGGSLPANPTVRERVTLRTSCLSQKQLPVVAGASARPVGTGHVCKHSPKCKSALLTTVFIIFSKNNPKFSFPEDSN